MSTIKTTPETNLTPRGPDSWPELLVDKGEYGQLKVMRHVVNKGRLDYGDADWFNWAYGSVDAEKCSLDARAEPLVSNSGTTNSIDGNGIRSLRLVWVPGPKFTAQMTAEVTVRVLGNLTLKSVVSGNIESAAVSAGSHVSATARLLGTTTTKSTEVSATSTDVEVDRKVETDVGANGKVEQTSNVSGNVEVDATGTPTGGGAKAEQNTSLGGAADARRKTESNFKAKRNGAQPSIVAETVSLEARATDTLSFAKLESDPFQTSLGVTCTAESSGNDVVSEASIQVSSTWEFEVAIKENGTRLAAGTDPYRELTPAESRKAALVALMERGYHASVAGAALGLRSASALEKALSVPLPAGATRRDLPGDLVGFVDDRPASGSGVVVSDAAFEAAVELRVTERLRKLRELSLGGSRKIGLAKLGREASGTPFGLDSADTDRLDSILAAAMREILRRGLDNADAAAPAPTAAPHAADGGNAPTAHDAVVDPDDISID